MRLDGKTVAEVTADSGLSAPTVIAAHKAYLKGGWKAVQVKPRGRPAGNPLSNEKQLALRSGLLATQPESTNSNARLWSYALANKWLRRQGQQLTDRTASSWFSRWQLTASAQIDVLKQSEFQADKHWLENTYPQALAQAKLRQVQLLWAGVTAKDGFILFHAHTTRRKFLWMTDTAATPSESACIEFFERLLHETNNQAVVILKGINIARTPLLLEWLEQHSNVLLLIPAAGAEVLPASLHGKPDVARSRATTTTDKTDSNKPQIQQLRQKQTEDAPTNNSKKNIDNPGKRIKNRITKMEPTTDIHMNNVADTPSENQGTSPDPADTLAKPTGTTLTHLQRLEAESIHIMREVVAESENPVMMYSVGKDSAVMLHLAMKAFYPAKPPFPLLHVDTTWKFRAMYEFRDKMVDELGFELLTHINPDGVAQKVNPFTHGSALHTDIMKTEGLKQALNKHKFDVAFGGARRDEEKSRAKERIFSFRTAQHRWEPKSQRPELWHLYNARKRPGESIRVFPISNWTELDIWQYIHLESIPIVPLYYAAERPVVERDGTLIMVDDDRMPLHPGEVPMMRSVRFRTLGCYPLTGAVESTATTLPEIIQEMLLTKTSERQGRMIDHDTSASMEKKKQEGYF